jgi:hypothetical protein
MRTHLSTWTQRIAQWGPWTAVTGTFFLIAGLIWDVTIHEGDPSLAAHESVFTVDNPAHVVFLTGIALIVVGMGLFLFAELRLMRAQRRGPWTGIVAFLAVALLVLAVAGVAAAAQTQLVTSSTTAAAGHAHGATPGASGAPAAHHATFVTTGPGCTAEGTPPTAAEQAAALQLTARVKAAWSPTLTLAQAVALGYRAPVTTPANPTLVHYVDPALVKETTDLMDPSRPQALVFLHLPDGTTLLGGVLFTAPIGTGPCPGGALTLWHYHQAGAVREMIHVWLYDNPTGAFSTGTGGKTGLLVAQRELEATPGATLAPQT